MKCPKCGTEVKDGMKFCMECGTAVSLTNTTESWLVIEAYFSSDNGDHLMEIARCGNKEAAEQELRSRIAEAIDSEAEDRMVSSAFGEDGYSWNYDDGEYVSSYAWRAFKI